jgi:hypothetical protein
MVSEIEGFGKIAQCRHGIGAILARNKAVRIIGVAGGILDVVHLVPEPLQAD